MAQIAQRELSERGEANTTPPEMVNPCKPNPLGFSRHTGTIPEGLVEKDGVYSPERGMRALSVG